MRGRIATRYSFCFLLLLLTVLGEARSQPITLTEGEYLNQFASPVLLVNRTINNADPTALQNLVMKKGENEQWDLSGVETTPLDSAVYERMSLTSAELDLSKFPTANHVIKIYSATKSSTSPVFYNYYNLTEQGVSLLGVIQLADTDPQTPGMESTVITYKNPHTLGVFPLQIGATFSSTYEVGTASVTTTSLVEGWGTLVLPKAQDEALRVWTEVKSTTDNNTVTSYVVHFITESNVSAVINLDQNKNYVSSTVQYARAYVPTASEKNERPAKQTLAPNYPNPFSRSTSIPVTLEKPANVSLKIYNMLGQQVQELAGGLQSAGEHVFVWDAADQPSGQYVYRLEIDGRLAATRVLSVVR